MLTNVRFYFAIANLACLLAIAAFPAAAQYGSTIRSGRPGQAMGTFTLGAKVLQVEAGLNFRQRDEGPNTLRTYQQTTVLRVGLTENFEASAVVQTQRTRTRGSSMDRASAELGISGTQLGVRYNILDGSGNTPAVAIQTRLLLRAQSDQYRRAGVGQTTIVSAGQSLTDWLGLTANVGFTHSGNPPAGTNSFYVIGAGFALGNNLSAVLEAYGTFNEFDVNVDLGFAYLVNSNLQLDLLGGIEGFGEFQGDLPTVKDDFFLGVGASWRFDWRQPQN